jgi:hypothetical protein
VLEGVTVTTGAVVEDSGVVVDEAGWGDELDVEGVGVDEGVGVGVLGDGVLEGV